MDKRNLWETQNCSSLFIHSYTIQTFITAMLLYLKIPHLLQCKTGSPLNLVLKYVRKSWICARSTNSKLDHAEPNQGLQHQIMWDALFWDVTKGRMNNLLFPFSRVQVPEREQSMTEVKWHFVWGTTMTTFSIIYLFKDPRLFGNQLFLFYSKEALT